MRTIVTKRKVANRAEAETTGEGVVRFCILGYASATKSSRFTPAKLVEALQVGLPFRELIELQTRLAVPADKLAPMLGISKATFHRRKGGAAKLPPAVSDRVVRYARLLGQALQVFGNQDTAKQWLSAPQFGLGGAVPLDYARSEVGAREVENLLGRIEYGVYS